ncbi:hypothetical protein [Streptomyces sp. NPDC101132]|uniref:hypothetical protein n=1 Tax=Streptomyces sp. NPDC101132 TaxID=3366110 RepID=UPI00380E349E
MPERTYPSQQDEALRQAGPGPDARAVLTAIADRLTENWPDLVARESSRPALALRYSTELYGFHTRRALAAEAETLKHAPQVRDDETRGEYALRLRKAAGGAR